MTVGKTLLMVEHDMGVVFGLADKIAVLVYGEVIAFDTPGEGARQPARAGGLPRLGARRCAGGRGTDMLDSSTNLHAYYGKSHVLHGVDLDVGEGEIVSLLGRNGSGRSTTVKAIMGLVDGTGSVDFKRPGDRWAARPSRSPTGASATCRRTATSFPSSRSTRT